MLGAAADGTRARPGSIADCPAVEPAPRRLLANAGNQGMPLGSVLVFKRVRGPQESNHGGGVVKVTRAVTTGLATLLATAGAAQAAAPELSVSNRLQDRRVVAAGE